MSGTGAGRGLTPNLAISIESGKSRASWNSSSVSLELSVLDRDTFELSRRRRRNFASVSMMNNSCSMGGRLGKNVSVGSESWKQMMEVGGREESTSEESKCNPLFGTQGDG